MSESEGREIVSISVCQEDIDRLRSVSGTSDPDRIHRIVEKYHLSEVKAEAREKNYGTTVGIYKEDKENYFGAWGGGEIPGSRYADQLYALLNHVEYEERVQLDQVNNLIL